MAKRYRKSSIHRYIGVIQEASSEFWDNIEKKLSSVIEKMDIFEEEHKRLMEHQGPATPEFIHQLKKELKFMKGLWVFNMVCILILMIVIILR